MPEYKVMVRENSLYWVMVAVLFGVLAVSAFALWDDTPFAAMGFMLLGGFLPFLLLGILLQQTRAIVKAPPLNGWPVILLMILAIVAVVVGAFVLIDGATLLAGIVWIMVGVFGLSIWMWSGWVMALLNIRAFAFGLFFWGLLLAVLGIIGTIRGDEIMAALALVFLALVIFLPFFWLLRSGGGSSAEVVAVPVPFQFWAIVMLPLVFLIAGMFIFGFSADTTLVASDESRTDTTLPVEESPEDTAPPGDDPAEDSPEDTAPPEDEDEPAEDTPEDTAPPDEDEPADTVEKPTNSPTWENHAEVLGDATFATPPTQLPVELVQFRSGPNALPDDPYLHFDSVTHGDVDLSEDQINALPGRIGEGAPGRYSVITIRPSGEANPGVDYQPGLFINTIPFVSSPADGQVAFGEGLSDVFLRAFLDESANTLAVFDQNFSPTEADIFFTSGNGYWSAFIGQSAVPTGGFAWLTRFGRDIEGLAGSPAGYTAIGPLQVGGQLLGGYDISTSDPALNCDNLGDFAWCYDGTDIRHIFRFGSCLVAPDAEPDLGYTLYPGPAGNTDLPDEPITITDIASGDSFDIAPSDWGDPGVLVAGGEPNASDQPLARRGVHLSCRASWR